MESKSENKIPSGLEASQLTLPLKILFGLNGASISFPSLAYMAIINDRARIPVSILSAYGAIAFLPWSFKPMYASIASALNQRLHRHILISTLLLASGIAIMVTSVIPEGGVKICFVVAFCRAILEAFPEFLLGLTLLDEARAVTTSYLQSTSDANEPSSNGVDGNHNIYIEPVQANHKNIEKRNIFNTTSGMFQAQAATCRNLGSLASSIVLSVLLIIRQLSSNASMNDDGSAANNTKENDQLSDRIVTLMLFITALLPISGSIIAIIHKVGTSQTTDQIWNSDGYGTLEASDSDELELSNIHTESAATQSFEDTCELPHPETQQRSPTNPLHTNALSKLDISIICCFQIIIVLFGLKQIIVQNHPILWQNSFITFTLVTLSLVMYTSISAWRANNPTRSLIQRGPAFFLILKHAMPNISYQWSSYIYYLFRSQPIYLQILSLVGSIITTCGSKFYEKVIAPRFSNLIVVFTVTTFLSIAVSILYLIPAHFLDEDTTGRTEHYFFIVLVIGMLSSFFGELSFLPSVILATNSVQYIDSVIMEEIEEDEDDDASLEGMNAKLAADSKQIMKYEKSDDLLAIEYGTYVACIDFGDQLGSWMTVPIVSALAINRGDWSRLGELILICAGFNIIPLLFLWVLPGSKRYLNNN